MEILYNKEGVPLLATGEKTFVSTTGSKKVTEEPNEEFGFQNIDYVTWGGNNRLPDDMADIIGRTGVLSTALNYKCRVCFGQGVVPVKVTGYDDKMSEMYDVVNNAEVIRYLNSYQFRNYHTSVFRDLIKFGNAFPIMHFNITGKKIVSVSVMNARHCRLSTDKTHLVAYGGFKEGSLPDKETSIVYEVLDEGDPFYHLEWLRKNNRLKGKAIAFPRLKNYFSNNDYYAMPDWDTAYRSGWIDVALQIPTFLKKAYKNAMSLMWHIRIPYAYWDKRFPKEQFNSVTDRENAINAYMQQIEDCLTGEENAQKTLFTNYAINESGKAEEKWEIERLDSAIKADERLSTSAAANSEILFSLMVNPSVLGAGMPGGPYAGNAGSGSDIREGFMASVILSHIERNQVLDPIELMFQFNGVEDVDIKYRNLILTTLDTGKSTAEKVS